MYRYSEGEGESVEYQYLLEYSPTQTPVPAPVVHGSPNNPTTMDKPTTPFWWGMFSRYLAGNNILFPILAIIPVRQQ